METKDKEHRIYFVTLMGSVVNVVLLVFKFMAGILVALMNKAGGSAAFGRWASTHIHSRAGAQFAVLKEPTTLCSP